MAIRFQCSSRVCEIGLTDCYWLLVRQNCSLWTEMLRNHHHRSLDIKVYPVFYQIGPSGISGEGQREKARVLLITPSCQQDRCMSSQGLFHLFLLPPSSLPTCALKHHLSLPLFTFAPVLMSRPWVIWPIFIQCPICQWHRLSQSRRLSHRGLHTRKTCWNRQLIWGLGLSESSD